MKRGFGKYYIVPAVPSALLAWGSLAAVLGLPVEWFGAWYEAAAAGIWVGASALPGRLSPLIRRGAMTGGFIALYYSLGSSIGEEGNEWVLSVTFIIITAGLVAGLFFRRSVAALAILPLSTSGALATALHAATGLHWTWYSLGGALAGAGYIFLAALEPPSQRALWQAAAAALWLFAVGFAHAGMGAEGAPRFVIPANYAAVLGGVGSGVVLWRLSWRPGIAAVPPLGAGLVASLLWAWLEMPLEWLPVFAASAASGYLATADLDPSVRRSWQLAYFAIGSAAVLASVLVAADLADGSTERWEVVATVAVALAAAAAGVARWRTAWRPGMAVVPLLAAGSAAAFLWAAIEMPLEWLPLFAMAAAAGHLLIAVIDRDRRSGWQWGALGGGGVAAVASFAVAVSVEDPSQSAIWQLPATLGVALAATAAGVVRWRLAWRPGVAELPPLAAAAAAALLWAWVEIPSESLAMFAAAAPAGFLAIAEWDRPMLQRWRLAALAAGGVAVAMGHVFASRPDPGFRAQLPVTYGSVLLAAVFDSVRRRDRGALLVPALVSAGAASLLWALEVGTWWWAVPPAGVGLAIAATDRLWSRQEELRLVGWPYALVLAVTPLVFVGLHFGHNAAGLAANSVAALALGIAALRSRGAVSRFLAADAPEAQPRRREAEVFLLAAISAVFVFSAAGHFNAVLTVTEEARTWAFVATASTAWLAVTVLGRRRLPLTVFTPAGAAGFAIAAALASDSGALVTFVLALATAWPAVAFATTRAWTLWLVAFAFAALTARAFWFWQGIDLAWLPLAYTAAAGATWALMLAVRRYGPLRTERDAAVEALSWAPWAVAGATAAFLLSSRAGRLAPADSLAVTQEWAVSAAVLAALSSAVVGEALRYRSRGFVAGGTAGLLLSLLMLIATTEPANAQAYTVPAGLYLLVLGLTFRRSEPLFGPHMAMHEALIIAGALALVLPPAAQSFSSDGGRYGFEVIGFGLAFLAAGLVIHSRWLIPSGVVCLTGVAIRWLTGGYVSVPYWAVLGILGTALLGFGMFLLFERQTWDSTKERVSRWWLSGFSGAP